MITSHTVLMSPKLDKHFTLHMDASGNGVGAILCQEDEKGQERPVAYFSRQFKPAELKYTVNVWLLWQE